MELLSNRPLGEYAREHRPGKRRHPKTEEAMWTQPANTSWNGWVVKHFLSKCHLNHEQWTYLTIFDPAYFWPLKTQAFSWTPGRSDLLKNGFTSKFSQKYWNRDQHISLLCSFSFVMEHNRPSGQIRNFRNGPTHTRNSWNGPAKIRNSWDGPARNSWIGLAQFGNYQFRLAHFRDFSVCAVPFREFLIWCWPRKCRFFGMYNFYSFSVKLHLVCVILYFYQKCARKAVVFWKKKLHSLHKYYTTAGRKGRDKSQICFSSFEFEI